ncbi:MAG: YtxH domain-containing protein [Bacteroides sp.]|nr:YtxH domain-containing protein [Bacteroides sp.]MCM1379474.1 YtxH domain-containing protein [Bacteroides sp.]MCM1445923.1 YtxH domain-containing protein [Prevotella sp.]
MKNFSIFLAVIGGAAIGAAAGLLFAPESGEKTRENIKKYLREKGICPTNESKLDELVDEIADELKKK